MRKCRCLIAGSFSATAFMMISVDTVAGIRAPFRVQEHFARLQRSLDAIRIANPLRLDQWLDLTAEIIERHPWARQWRTFRSREASPNATIRFRRASLRPCWSVPDRGLRFPASRSNFGVSAVTHADERWLHCDIKSTSLLGNVLMKQYAIDQGASETVMLLTATSPKARARISA